MNFLRRQRYALLTVAVLALGCILVTLQTGQNETSHLRTRENFIHLVQIGQTKDAEHHYQTLITKLSRLPDRTLLADLQRLTLMDVREKQDPGSLLAKYRTALENVLERRSQQRVQRLLKKTPAPAP